MRSKLKTVTELEQINGRLQIQIDGFKNKILKLENKSLKQERKIIILQTENEKLKEEIKSSPGLMQKVIAEIAVMNKTEHDKPPIK